MVVKKFPTITASCVYSTLDMTNLNKYSVVFYTLMTSIICRYVGMQICRYVDMYVGMQICRYVGMQICRYVGMQVCRYASM